jgi:signal transduction histidine kinase
MFLLGHLVRLSEERQEQAKALVEEEKRTRVARTEAATLDERGRIAREMHDVLAHSLSALAVELEGARLLARDRDADPQVVAAIERAHRHASSGLAEARAAIETLRGDAVPGPDRLTELASSFGAQGTACELEVDGEPRPLPSEAGLAIYRTAQEALTNVRKHAHADRVDMRLEYGADGVSLVVEDVASVNGNGRAPQPPALVRAGSGYGVSGMRERAELIGGRLTAGPTAGGYRVELWVPA